MNLFNLRFQVSKFIKSEDWSKNDLYKVLTRLKKNKSADSNFFLFQLFIRFLGEDDNNYRWYNLRQ